MIVLKGYREYDPSAIGIEADLLPLVTMLPGRWDHRLVEVHAADPDVSVSATNRGDDSIAHTGTVIAERCCNVWRKFLEQWSQSPASETSW